MTLIRDTLHKIPRPLLAFIVGLLPFLVTLLLIAIFLRGNLLHFRPTTWNDQTYNWHQISTFREVGLNGGYYTVYERAASQDVFRFGAHGFLYPALFAAAGRVIGWETYSGILINAALMAVGIWITIRVMRLDQTQMLLLALLLLAVTPVLMYLPTISQETFQQAAALIFASIFYILLQRKGDLPRWLWVTAFAFLVLVSMLRFSWVMLVLPFLLLGQKRLSFRRLGLSLFASAVFAVSILLIVQQTSAPGNNAIFARINTVSTSPLSGLENLLAIASSNLAEMLTIPNIHQIKIENVQVIQFFVLLFGLLIFPLLRDTKADNTPRLIDYFQLYNLLLILLASLVFYLTGGYYRVLAPHIILTCALLIAYRQYRLVIVVIVIGLISTGTFLAGYAQWRINFSDQSSPQHADITTAFEAHIQYDPQAGDIWCNTLLLPVWMLDDRVTFIPAGIGLSFFSDPYLQTTPLRSKYLLFDSRAYDIFEQDLNVELLASTRLGRIYHNLDSAC